MSKYKIRTIKKKVNKKKYQRSGGKKYIGTFLSTKQEFGFVRVEGNENDYFIPSKYTLGAMDGDTVEIELLEARRGSSDEARVVNIKERSVTQIVGIYDKTKNYGFVISDDPKVRSDIYIAPGDDMGASFGDKVMCEILTYRTESQNATGKIIEILGASGGAGVDVLSIIRGYGIPDEFENAVLTQAKRVAKPVSEADMSGRCDLRDVMMVTIDGADSKDLDDAVSLSYDNGIYTLGVHIADVTNYVQGGSALDKEARRRGTSVYFADRVIPMLPVELSNGICSLNAGEDRLALSCIMKIDDSGNTMDVSIVESVVNIDKRMTYDDVSAIIEGDEKLKTEYSDFVSMFLLMNELSTILENKRSKRGEIDFDFKESKLTLSPSGDVLDVSLIERSSSSRIIESFMLAANESVAEFFYHLNTPFMYRIHPKPDKDKITDLANLAGKFGLTVTKNANGEVYSKDISNLLHSAADSNAKDLISTVALRSMQQAKYSAENTGHFGLAAKYYCHFTSPIRRYPDLYIHRIIKHYLRGRLNDKRIAEIKMDVAGAAISSSMLERRAEEAEREVDKLKKVQYMTKFIGKTFDAKISSTTKWGLYVSLDNGIEGLIHISNLRGDHFNYIEEDFMIVGENTGKTYSIGDDIRVKCVSTDEYMRTIDFDLAD